MNYKIIFLIIIITAGLRCTNPFNTREPEKPVSGSEVYDNATDPSVVLDNMIMAFREKNLTEYVNVFASDNDGGVPGAYMFSFEPEPSLNESFIGRWTLTDEQAYFRNLINSSSGNYPVLSLSFNVPEYSFTPITSGSQNDSVRTGSMQYILTVDSGDSTAIYNGNLEFKLFRSTADQFWYIYHWQDNAIEQNPNRSWSYLKIQYY